MNRQTAQALLVAALRSVAIVAVDGIDFPTKRIDSTLTAPDGTSFAVFRETARPEGDTASDGVTLVFRFAITRRPLAGVARFALYHRLANVASPFFVGMSGFRRKLWLAGDDHGTYLELYEWASESDAEAFVDVLQGLLGPLDAAGWATYEIVDAPSIDAFVADSDYTWERDEPDRRRRYAPIIFALIGVLVLGYVVARRRFRRRSFGAAAPA